MKSKELSSKVSPFVSFVMTTFYPVVLPSYFPAEPNQSQRITITIHKWIFFFLKVPHRVVSDCSGLKLFVLQACFCGPASWSRSNT